MTNLAARLRAIVEYKAAWKRDPSGQFEKLAEQFYRETGLMAPGKSVPMAMAGCQDDVERQQRWNEFTARLSANRDATILEAADSIAAQERLVQEASSPVAATPDGQTRESERP